MKDSRRTFLKKSAAAGIAGIVTSGKAPAFSREMNTVKIGQIGLGSHSFLLRFRNPPKSHKGTVKCIPNGVGRRAWCGGSYEQARVRESL